MKSVSEEEDIRKWTEERKKRFPTKNNINLRKAADLEKLERGEIIKQNRHSLKATAKTINRCGKKRKPYKRVTHGTDDCPQADEIYRGIRLFPGIGILQEENLSKTCLDEESEQLDSCKEISNDISDEDEYVPQAVAEPKVTNLCIPSLVANYESEDEEDSPEEVPAKRTKIEDLQNQNTAENITENLQKISNNSQFCTIANENKSNQTMDKEINRCPVPKRQDKPKHKNQIEDKKHEVSIKHRNNLLQMLLSRSIQHERNLISQCLKFIVDNHFFKTSESGK